MDSSNAPTISSNANNVYFKGPYLRQNWSLPDSIIYYLAKNPKSPYLYQILIQSCKYFFSKNPVIVCSVLTFNGKENVSEIEIEHDGENKYIDLKNISHKFWITDDIRIYAKDTAKENLISSLIPNIYQCDTYYLHLSSQFISFNELVFLVSKANIICLSECTIKNGNGSIVPFEKIFEACVQVKNFEIFFNENDSSISSKTVENLIKIPHFSSIYLFCLNQISEVFDIETFYVYMKKNKLTSFNLRFHDSVSEVYENRLDEILAENFGIENPDFIKPYISIG